MDRIPDFMQRHPQWSALLLGLLSATGFQPLHLWPVGLAAMAALVWLLFRQEGRRSVFLTGWLFGVAHFTLTNNWIATAFTYQAEMPAALGWVAVPLLSLYLALWPALAGLGAWMLARRGGMPAFILAFGALWIAAEWLRSWVFTGYIWGPFSMMLLGDWERPGAAAVLPWLGTYALSGLAVGAAGFMAWFIASKRWVPAAVFAAVIATGMLLPAGEAEEGYLPVTLVQPNLRQEELDDPTKFEEQFQRIAALSKPQREVSRRLVLWPESGVPDYLRDGYPLRYYIQMTAGADPAFARYRIGQTIGEGSLLLTGAVDLEIGEVGGREKAVGAYNAITPIDAEGNLGQRYSKAHLVPYGEYLPLRTLLEPLGMSRLVAGSIDFNPGPGPQTIDLGPYGKSGMQICYEIIFSGEVAERGNRPDYIFNPSNDGWFGAWGPPQHLAQARMRAIEEGLPVLRSTTTGISAIIDARGVVREYIGRNRADRIDTLVPPAGAPTLFSKFGHWLTLVWGIAFLLASVVVMRLRLRYPQAET
ncbi:apolipoprotein N-acyltransferase [Qipengyuania sphaerica]|uniref:apolipoprotein N-acyltransferase n=1 Tax=Qipengyuania sphaerica TaxID=2867243 RepID=UPI001C87C2C0|nr:apolipoprotein N-acyltransferase [Qipengyuania sphaerica]MBX7541322.1 apolipoprotein N-acyltransferase [Qipengyuania sphaerica]